MKYIKTNKWKYLLTGVLLSSLTITLSAAPVKIMFLGDSITVGDAQLPISPDANKSNYRVMVDNNITYPHIAFDKQLAYRGMLSWLLKKDGYTISGTKTGTHDSTAKLDFVGINHKNSNKYSEADNNDTSFDEDHEGYSGISSGGLLKKMPSILTANIPDIVLLHIGTNDAGAGIGINTTVGNVEKILTKIFNKNGNAKILIARIIEARRIEKVSQEGWKTKKFNDAITQMVSKHTNKNQIKMVNMEYGAGLIYDPCGTKLGDMQPFHKDDSNHYDLHPNANGYKKMGQKWFDDLIASKWLPDIKAPVIRLNGGKKQDVLLNGEYTERNAIVTDDHDENLKITINSSAVKIDTNGTYAVTYDATDSAGNKAIQVIRVVNVTDKPDLDRDDNNNGLPDAVEAGWFDYNKITQKATLLHAGLLEIQKPLKTVPSADADSITLVHAVDEGLQAYISAKKDGKITTGIQEGEVKDNTLSSGSFAIGSKATIKKVNDKLLIEIETILAKDKKLTIGGN